MLSYFMMPLPPQTRYIFKVLEIIYEPVSGFRSGPNMTINEPFAIKLKLKAAVGNFRLQVNKLTLAVAWDWSNFAATVCVGSHLLCCLLSLSFKSSLNWDKTVAGKVEAE